METSSKHIIFTKGERGYHVRSLKTLRLRTNKDDLKFHNILTYNLCRICNKIKGTSLDWKQRQFTRL